MCGVYEWSDRPLSLHFEAINPEVQKHFCSFQLKLLFIKKKKTSELYLQGVNNLKHRIQEGLSVYSEK